MSDTTTQSPQFKSLEYPSNSSSFSLELQKIVCLLFGSEATLTNKLDTVPETFQFFAVLGKEGRYRWIIPKKACWGINVLKQWRPYGWVSQIQWQGWLALYQTGLNYLPKTQVFGVKNASPVWQPLMENKTAYVPVTYIGTPCQVQKLVASLVNTDENKQHCVLKLPLGKQAWPRIYQEANLLKSLETSENTPQLLALDFEQQYSIQQYVSGQLTTGQLTIEHIEWLLSLPHSGKTTSLFNILAQLQQQIDLARGSANEVVISELTEFIKQLRNTTEDSLIPVVIQHGDFAPWNLKKTPTGKLFGLDWEAGTLEGVPLFDITHFQLMLDYIIKPKNQPAESLPDRLLNSSAVQYYISQLSIQPTAAYALIYAYYVNFWLHHIKNNDFDYAEQYYNYIKPVLNKRW